MWAPLETIKKEYEARGGTWGSDLSLDDQIRKRALEEQAAAAGGFADYGEGGFRSLGTEADDVRMMLKQHALGQKSFSGEQLRQGLMQQQAAQRSYAASASPQNAAMAARNAALNMGRAQSGMTGQAAMADIAERQAFAKALADVTLQQRQQELQAALGSRQNALTGYGAGIPFVPQPSTGDKILGAARDVGMVLASRPKAPAPGAGK